MKRTELVAIAAAVAQIGLHRDPAVRLLLQGGGGAGADTGRVPAMHAPFLEEEPPESIGPFVFREFDARPRLRRQLGGILITPAIRRAGVSPALQVVPLLAGDLAAAAGGTSGLVDQHRFPYHGHGRSSYAFFTSTRNALYSGMVVLPSPTCG